MAIGADLGKRYEGLGAQLTPQSQLIRPRIGEAVGMLQKDAEELEEALKALRGILGVVMESKEELDKVLPEPSLSTWVPMGGELEYVQRKMVQCLVIVRDIQGRLWL